MQLVAIHLICALIVGYNQVFVTVVQQVSSECYSHKKINFLPGQEIFIIIRAYYKFGRNNPVLV